MRSLPGAVEGAGVGVVTGILNATRTSVFRFLAWFMLASWEGRSFFFVISSPSLD